MLDLFITGTDTGVGKTHVAALFAQRAVQQKLHPGYLKPVQTGSEIDDDARTVAAAAPPTQCVTAYRFRAPLAPAVAARLERAEMADIDHLVDVADELRASTDGIIVEGAGGILVPLNETKTMADLVLALGLPAVIVCRPDLGTLNHTALTVEACRRRGIKVAGIVINGCRSRPDLTERTNRAELARIAPIIEAVPLDAPVPA